MSSAVSARVWPSPDEVVSVPDRGSCINLVVIALVAVHSGENHIGRAQNAVEKDWLHRGRTAREAKAGDGCYTSTGRYCGVG